MGGMQPNLGPNLHPSQPPTPSSTANNVMDPNQSQQEDPIKSLLRQLANQPQVRFKFAYEKNKMLTIYFIYIAWYMGH